MGFQKCYLGSSISFFVILRGLTTIGKASYSEVSHFFNLAIFLGLYTYPVSQAF